MPTGCDSLRCCQDCAKRRRVPYTRRFLSIARSLRAISPFEEPRRSLGLQSLSLFCNATSWRSWVHGFMITGELTVAKIKRRGRDGESPLDSQNGKHTYMRSNRPASGLLPFQRLDHRLLHAQRFNMLRLSRNIHT